MKKRTSARRAASFLAVIGALVMSSGIAMMATATPANATQGTNHKDWVCKYVGKPGVDERLKKGNDGLVWVDTAATQGTWFNDAHGRSYVLLANAPHSPRPDASGCPSGDVPDEPALDATAAVDVTNPSCENENTPSYEISGSHVSWVVVDKDVTPGGFVTVKFTADSKHAFADESTEKTITKDFGPAQEGCGEVEVPGQASASADPIQPTCANPAGGYIPHVTHAAFTTTPAAVPGQTVHLIATADTKFTFNGSPTLDVPVTLNAAPTNCGSTTVSPPTTTSTTPTTSVSPPKTKSATKAKVQTQSASTVTPTLVHAGLTSVSAKDMRGTQGLALMFGGMLMLMAAGGLGLRVRGSASRI